jgi:hypothetical protein
MHRSIVLVLVLGALPVFFLNRSRCLPDNKQTRHDSWQTSAQRIR